MSFRIDQHHRSTNAEDEIWLQDPEHYLGGRS